MQITNILIWQKNNILRDFKLEENKVNVITGDSGTGKSSVLAIIDYCLLSSSSNGISKTNVDNYVLWYGIRFKLNNHYYVICRKATHLENDDYVYFDKNGIIPKLPQNNIRIKPLKEQLNKEFNIVSDLKIPYGGTTIRQGSQVSYRCFTPHSIIDQTTLTSPVDLYSKFSDLKIKERIERTFDMALGSENAETMIIRTKIESLQKKLARLEYKQTANQDLYLNFEEDIDLLFNDAYALGLFDKKDSSQLDSNEKLKVLKTISNYNNLNEIPAINEKIILEKELFLLKRKLKTIEDFIKSSDEYKKLLKENRDSLQIAKYLNENSDKIIYSSSIHEIIDSLLLQSLEINNAIAQKSTHSLTSKTKEKKEELENLIISVEEKINDFSTEEIDPSQIYRFIGKLEAELKSINSAPKQEDYRKSIKDIEDSISDLQEKLDDNDTYKELTFTLLNEQIKEILLRMPLKGFENPIPIFNKKKKTLDIVNNGHIEKMIDIGSASNYMYLHIAYFLAFHTLARTRNVQWMPRFLIIDQPSTPYFSTNGTKTDDFDSLDTALNELDSFIEKMKEHGGFQIILLEHIEEKYWIEKKLNNFKLVDKEFRGDYGLISFPQ